MALTVLAVVLITSGFVGMAVAVLTLLWWLLLFKQPDE